jgi:hypothetical protein
MIYPSTPDHVAVQVGPQDPDATAELTQRYGVGVNAAYVRGTNDATRVVTITYTVPSGRVAKAALGAWSSFTKSVEAFDQVRRAKMGLAAAQFAVAPQEGEQAPDASPELAEQRKLIEDMQAELARLRNPEPVDGYRELNAREAAQRAYDMDASQLDAVERYEAFAAGDESEADDQGRKGRKTVLAAVDKRREDLQQAAVDLEALRAARAAGTDPLAGKPSGDDADSET